MDAARPDDLGMEAVTRGLGALWLAARLAAARDGHRPPRRPRQVPETGRPPAGLEEIGLTS